MLAKKKPNIAIISIRNTYGFGGVLATLKTVYAFCEEYFQPTVFYLSFDKDISAHLRPPQYDSQTRGTTYFGMNCVEIGSRWAFWEPGHYRFTKNQWAEALRDFDYVFVVSATPIAGHPATLLKKKFVMWISTSYDQDRTQRVIQLQGLRKLLDRLGNDRMRKIERSVLQSASHIMALSNYSKQQFLSSLGGTKQELSICGYPLDAGRTATLSRPHDKKIIAIGRFSDPRKNIGMLLEAFDIIHQAMPEATLSIIGMPPERNVYQRFISRPSFEAVTFVGQVSHETLKFFYSTANLMLITSYQEGFGIAGLEGLLHGVPVVSTNCGGVSDYVIEDLTGFLVPIDDAQAMARKALYILGDPAVEQRLAAQGQALARSQFSEQKVYAQFKHALARVYPELQSHFTREDEEKVAQAKPVALAEGYA